MSTGTSQVRELDVNLDCKFTFSAHMEQIISNATNH